MKPKSSRRLVPLLAALICAANVFAYTFLANHWSASAASNGIEMHLQLGSSGALSDGSSTWGQVATSALNEWNGYLSRFRFLPIQNSPASIADGNGRNSVIFAPTVFGRSFGSTTLAVATSWTTGGFRTEADVVFNSNKSWNSYRGAQWTNGVYDFRRVALHEFGHVLGLNHPDEAGQSVAALMNSTTGNLDGLVQDDVLGGQALWGGTKPPPPPPPPPGSVHFTASMGEFDNYVRLTWTPSSFFSRYRIMRSASGTATFNTSVNHPASSYDDITAVPGQIYNYYLFGVTSAGVESDGSYEQKGMRALSSVAGVQATDNSTTGAIKVTWTPHLSFNEYRIYRNETNSTASAWHLGTSANGSGTYDDVTAVKGRTYYYWVRGYTGSVQKLTGFGTPDTGSVSPNSGDVGSVTGVTASDGTDSRYVYIQWNQVPGTNAYLVLRSATAGGATQQVGSVSRGVFETRETDTWFNDTSAVPGVTYWYYISHLYNPTPSNPNTLGWVVSAGDSGLRALAAPELDIFGINDGAGSTGNRTVTLVHFKSGGPPAEYMASESSSLSGAVWQPYVNVPSFLLSEGSGTKTVYFKLRNTAGESSVRSDTIVYQAPANPPVLSAMSLNANAASTTNAAVTVNHTLNGGAATHYMVSESAGFSGAAWVGYAAAPVYNLSAGFGTRTVYLKLKNADGESGSLSDSILYELGAPSAVTASDGSFTDRIRVTWAAVSGATHYRVYRGVTNNSANASALGSWQTGLTFDDLPVQNAPTAGVTYYYWVRAATSSTGSSPGAFSASDAGTMAIAPAPKPTNVAASDGTWGDRVRITWTGAAGATHYQVYRLMGGPIPVNTPLGTWQTATTFDDFGIIPAVSHGYHVFAAKDSNGSGASEASVSDTGFAAALAELTTTAATSITPNSAATGGNVTYAGRVTVTERGVVYATSLDPTTTSGTKVVSGSGTGSFTANLTGLAGSTLYHVRAYAINSAGTAYGAPVSFTTGSAALSAYQQWAAAAGSSGPNAAATATPWRDGVANLLKYAFNMNGSAPDTRILTSGSGTAGLPLITVQGPPTARVLRVEFLRRKGSGLTYIPKKSPGLNGAAWVPLTDVPAVVNINTTWERLVYEEPVSGGKWFARVEVLLP